MFRYFFQADTGGNSSKTLKESPIDKIQEVASNVVEEETGKNQDEGKEGEEKTTDEKNNSDKPMEDNTSNNEPKKIQRIRKVEELNPNYVKNGATIPKNEVIKYLKDRIEILKAMEAYEGKVCLDNIKGISDAYRNRYFKDRAQLCDILVSEGFSGK